jgi:hypothetical protein
MIGGTSEFMTVDAEFEIVDWQEEVYDQPDDGPTLSRATITKRYRGQIEGDGIAHVLTAPSQRRARATWPPNGSSALSAEGPAAS